MLTLSNIEERWGKITIRRLNSEWRRKHYINSVAGEIKYTLHHVDDGERRPLLQAVLKRSEDASHSTHAVAWKGVKLSDIEPYKEDGWERAIKDELDGIGAEMIQTIEEDKRLIAAGERNKISDFIAVSEEGLAKRRDLAWRIANVQASGKVK